MRRHTELSQWAYDPGSENLEDNTLSRVFSKLIVIQLMNWGEFRTDSATSLLLVYTISLA